MQAKQKNILVIGSGGREHAICWKLAQSEQVDKIICLPGNAGTARCQKTINVTGNPLDFAEVERIVDSQQIDLIWVGPENPLSEGIVDYFNAKNIAIFGPTKQAAQLEASKVFSKQFMQRFNLPTAQFEVFDDAELAYLFCEQNDWARIIKVDGLALGKGVYVCNTLEECRLALDEIFTQDKFGTSGNRVVIEEKLTGKEASLLCFCDGKKLLPLPYSQDHKRRFENDEGPNTGGMGAFAPLAWIKEYDTSIKETVLKPLELALEQVEFNYVGILFIGLMFDANNQPKILEFNCRFGDPETQCLLPLLKTDLLEITEACLAQKLSHLTLEFCDQYAACVVVSAETYPETSSKDVEVKILPWPSGALLFHAGTKWDNQTGKLLTNGGRLFNVVGLGDTLQSAVKNAYQAVESILFEGKGYRKDIALSALPKKLEQTMQKEISV